MPHPSTILQGKNNTIMTYSHALIHPVTLSLPELPQAAQGLRVAHLTDIHISKPSRDQDELLNLIATLEVDLFLLTGDYMSLPGDELAAIPFMHRLSEVMKPRIGSFGVFGNHDLPTLRHQLQDMPIHWLNNQTHLLPEIGVEIAGMETLQQVWPDSLALLEHRASLQPSNDGQRFLRLLLCHHPTYLPVASDLKFDVMLSGHTHGGQCRLPGKRPLINSTDYPMHLTSGILRNRNTLGLVSRGLGEVHLPIRLFCPPQLPIYRFQQGPLPGEDTAHICNTQPW